jgi:hypothetical protein
MCDVEIVYIYPASHMPNIETQWQDLDKEGAIAVVLIVVIIEASTSTSEGV